MVSTVINESSRTSLKCALHFDCSTKTGTGNHLKDPVFFNISLFDEPFLMNTLNKTEKNSVRWA